MTKPITNEVRKDEARDLKLSAARWERTGVGLAMMMVFIFLVSNIAGVVINIIINSTQTKQLTEQTDLITCLLQLHIGGDFTNREQCQEKVDTASDNLTDNTPAPAQDQPPTQPQTQSQPQPVPPQVGPPEPKDQGLVPDDLPILGGL